MRLSDIKGESAIDMLADLVEPASVIFSDKSIQNIIETGNMESINKPKLIKYLLSRYKKEIIEILAILNGKKVEEFEFNIFTLPKQIMEILSDEEMISFFAQYLTDEAETSSSGVTEHITENQ